MRAFLAGFGLLAVASLMGFGSSAFAQEAQVSAPLPRTMASPMRLIPELGVSSFANDTSVHTNNFSQGFSASLLADFGDNYWNFETGIETLKSQINRGERSAAVDVNTWGIPALAKYNLSGRPHETIFFKAGVMPFAANGDNINQFNVMAVGGVGGALPLGRNSSVLIDATYNRLVNNSGDLTNYQGIALLAGLSLNL